MGDGIQWVVVFHRVLPDDHNRWGQLTNCISERNSVKCSSLSLQLRGLAVGSRATMVYIDRSHYGIHRPYTNWQANHHRRPGHAARVERAYHYTSLEEGTGTGDIDDYTYPALPKCSGSSKVHLSTERTQEDRQHRHRYNLENNSTDRESSA
jgi:hypothetical protein